MKKFYLVFYNIVGLFIYLIINYTLYSETFELQSALIRAVLILAALNLASWIMRRNKTQDRES